MHKGREVNLEECWLYAGYCDNRDYGRISVTGKTYFAHRVVYEAIKGVIPDGLVIDHLCRVHRCVNPYHLEPVTQKENFHRGIRSTIKAHATKTHCLRGHQYTPENTYTYPNRRKRWCRACFRIKSKENYWKNKT